MQKKFRRRKYLIDRKWQLKYTLIVISIILITNLISISGLYYIMWGAIVEEFSEGTTQEKLEQIDRISVMQESREKINGKAMMPKFLREAKMLSEEQKGQLNNIIKKSQKNIFPKILILLSLIAISSVFITHRVAGPLFRMKKMLRDLNAGKIPFDTGKFKIRKHDQIKELAQELDRAIQNYTKLYQNYSSLLSNINALYEVMQKKGSDANILSKIREIHKNYCLTNDEARNEEL